MRIHRSKLKISLLGFLMVFSLITQVSGGYYLWVRIGSDTVKTGMFDPSPARTNTYGYTETLVSDPSYLRIKTWTNLPGEYSWAKFTYDTGRNDAGGAVTQGNGQAQAFIYWTLTGHLDSNSDPNSFMKFTYNLFYLSGSTVHIVGTSEYKYTTAHDYISESVTHSVSSSSIVYSGIKLYVLITFELSSHADWNQWNQLSDFYNGGNHMALSSVVYEQYLYFNYKYI